MAAVQFDDLDGWATSLTKVAETLVARAEQQLVELAPRLEAEMRAAAPKPRKGTRAATIHTKVRKGKRRTVIDIGPTPEAFSLVFDEFGTSRQPARPWVRPVLAAGWAGWNPWGPG